MITDGFCYVAVLLFMAGALVTLEKAAKGALKTVLKYVPSVVTQGDGPFVLTQIDAIW